MFYANRGTEHNFKLILILLPKTLLLSTPNISHLLTAEIKIFVLIEMFFINNLFLVHVCKSSVCLTVPTLPFINLSRYITN